MYDKILKIVAIVFKWIIERIRKTSKPAGDFLRLNFTDLGGRIDTGRIGQFSGLISLLIITYYTLIAVIWDISDSNLTAAIMTSAASAVPLALYRLKDFSGTAGTKFHRVMSGGDPKKYKKLSFFKRNFLDEFRRVDTGRIGQLFGLTAMIISMSYIIYVYTYPLFNGGNNLEIDLDKLILISADSAYPMLLYRLKHMSSRMSGVED